MYILFIKMSYYRSKSYKEVVTGKPDESRGDLKNMKRKLLCPDCGEIETNEEYLFCAQVDYQTNIIDEKTGHKKWAYKIQCTNDGCDRWIIVRFHGQPIDLVL